MILKITKKAKEWAPLSAKLNCQSQRIAKKTVNIINKVDRICNMYKLHIILSAPGECTSKGDAQVGVHKQQEGWVL